MKALIQLAAITELAASFLSNPGNSFAARTHKKVAERTIQLCDATRDGNIEKMKSLIAEGADVNAKSQRGNTPLHIATIGNRKNVVELLIANGTDASLENELGQNPMDIAILESHPEIAKLLTAESKPVAGHIAAFTGNLARVSRMSISHGRSLR